MSAEALFLAIRENPKTICTGWPPPIGSTSTATSRARSSSASNAGGLYLSGSLQD